ncbi:MAG: hypothetical protein R3C19_11660 [Planctomycetaceae bacterium]
MLRESASATKDTKADFEIAWTVHEDNIGMGIAERKREIAASTFQAANPALCIVICS